MLDPRSITTELTFPNPYRAPKSTTLESALSRLSGHDRIGGALLLFVGLQFAGVVTGIYNFTTGTGAVAWAHQRGLFSLAETLRAERVLVPVTLMALTVGLIAIFGRFKWTPMYWQVYFGATAFLSAYFAYTLWHATLPIEDLELSFGMKTAAIQYVGTIFGSVLWLVYWVRSQRVAARFS